MMQPIPPTYTETLLVPQPPAESGSNPQSSLLQGQGQRQINNQNGCPQIIYAYSPVSTKYHNFRYRQSIVLSICQIILGLCCIAFNGGLIGIFTNYLYIHHHYYTTGAEISVVGYGIWGGVFFILTGCFGIAAGKTKSKCWIITFMVFCILSAMAAAVIFALSILATVVSVVQSAMALNILLIILSVFEAILAIWASALCCSAACCCAPTQDSVLAGQPVQFASMNGQPQVVFLAPPTAIPQIYTPYPGYPMQVAMAAPLYPTPAPGVPLNHAVTGGMDNQGMEKVPLDDIPNVM